MGKVKPDMRTKVITRGNSSMGIGLARVS